MEPMLFGVAGADDDDALAEIGRPGPDRGSAKFDPSPLRGGPGSTLDRGLEQAQAAGVDMSGDAQAIQEDGASETLRAQLPDDAQEDAPQ
jgi:hypothetical protein